MKILFCHIPKCSGTNIHYFLNKKYTNKKYKWYIHRILKYDYKKYKDYYKFTVIKRSNSKSNINLFLFETIS